MGFAGASEPGKTQRDRLRLIATGPRDYRADDRINLMLEKRGLIRRIGTARIGRFMRQPALRWEITAQGLAVLSEG